MPSFTSLKTLLVVAFATSLPSLVFSAPTPRLDLPISIPSEFCTTKSGSAHPASTPTPGANAHRFIHFGRRADGLGGGLISGAGGLGPVGDIINGLPILGANGNENNGPGYPQPGTPPSPPAGGGWGGAIPPSPAPRPADPTPPQQPAPRALINLKADSDSSSKAASPASAPQPSLTPGGLVSIPGGDAVPAAGVGGGDAEGLLDGVNGLPLGDVIGGIIGGGKASNGQTDAGKAKRMVMQRGDVSLHL